MALKIRDELKKLFFFSQILRCPEQSTYTDRLTPLKLESALLYPSFCYFCVYEVKYLLWNAVMENK